MYIEHSSLGKRRAENGRKKCETANAQLMSRLNGIRIKLSVLFFL